MTALLDKLKGTGGAHAAGGGGQVSPRSGSTRATAPQDVAKNPASNPWLDQTQVSDPPSQLMTFNYPPGSTPLPRYTIRRGIGMGGFGDVYFAVSDAGKEVALKRIQRNLEVELRGVSHCLNLKHPNLVSVYDICRDDSGQWWVVMEYVAGRNLRQVLDESPQGLPPAEVERWLRAIALGVHHLHSSGLVHRDLKPGNVFDDLGIVKVGDYGLSKFISASHRGGHTESVGTFHYMAPEIGRGQYGREIDIYALGIMLFEMLTGDVPFDGESCHEIIVKHLTATPDLTGIHQPYRSTIARCLEKDPAKRFATVLAMLQSLGMSDTSSAAVADPLPGVKATQVEEPINATLVRTSMATKGQVTSNLKAVSETTTDEPLARAVRDSLSDLNRWWRSLDRSPGSKVFLLLVAGFVLLVNTHWLLPLLSVLGIVYVPYYIVRQMVLHSRMQPSYAEAQRIARTVGPPRQPLTRLQWRSQMRSGLRAKHSIHRVAELNASWIAATFTAIGLALVSGIIGLRSGPVDALAIAPYGWMATVVLLASLGILGMGKLWERDEGEGLPRRLVLAGVGAGVGAVAYAMSEFLMLPLNQGLARDVDASALPQALYHEGVPAASAMMAHFALLFAALRWWKPVDPLRRTRLSLWSVAVAVVVEWAVHQVLPIPQPAGMMIAGGLAIAVQMSAPWINPRAAGRVAACEAGPADARGVAARSLA